jgi:uncharacterized protein YjbI with pentapeptide repeats
MTKHCTASIAASLTTLLALFASASLARADIFTWEYINPASPGLGKQASTTLVPDGAGANAAPGANLSNRNLTKAYLIGADLGAYGEGCSEYGCENVYYSNLNGANLTLADLANASFDAATLLNTNYTQANLEGASFHGTALTGAILTASEVRGADFSRDDNYYPNTGISLAQLYSTASYQAHDLTGIRLSANDLTGVNLVGQNITNAILTNATLTGANLSQANLFFANFGGAKLDNADLSQTNLTHATFGDATLTGANMTGAEIRWASFLRVQYGTGISLAQLYSTASYQAHDLTGIGLFLNNLAGANLVGQNLTSANLVSATLTNADLRQANLSRAQFTSDTYVADLTGANLSHANLTNAYFAGYEFCGEIACGTSPGANLTNANLSGADARGADLYLAVLSGANTRNLIWNNGHIYGLDLTTGASLVVRDYDGNAAFAPIVVEQHLATDATGTLRLEFDADAWDSTVSFAPGISVALGGTLELDFAPGVNVAAQSGRTIDLFDWTGVTPIGVFTVSSPYVWDLSKLYTTGEVTLTAVAVLPGDYNGNGIVDAADYTVWRNGLGTTYTPADYGLWRSHFGQTADSGAAGYPLGASAALLSPTVPEPAALVLLMFAAVGWCFRRGRAA